MFGMLCGFPVDTIFMAAVECLHSVLYNETVEGCHLMYNLLVSANKDWKSSS